MKHDPVSHTFVCLSGAHHGGWCWSRTAKRMRDRGHVVHALTYVGTGDRAHLLHPGIGLHSYVEDVLALLDAEELDEVVMVGHSISGRVMSAVADVRPEALSKLIYLDAGLPLEGAPLSVQKPDYWKKKLATAIDVDGVACFAPTRPEEMGIVDPDDLEWVRRRLSPVPTTIFSDPTLLGNPIGNGLPKAYVRATRPIHPLVVDVVEKVRAEGWDVVDMAAGHDAMVTAPDLLADLLIDLAVRDLPA